VDHPDESARHVYQAPTPLVAAFYVILLVWSVICISLIDAILEEGGSSGVFPLFIIGFILFYMWYFSLAISYRLELRDDGEIRLRSLRRTLRTNAEGIAVVEFPRVGLGFIRFRLERECWRLSKAPIRTSWLKVSDAVIRGPRRAFRSP
jgi:hypothetical protein